MARTRQEDAASLILLAQREIPLAGGVVNATNIAKVCDPFGIDAGRITEGNTLIGTLTPSQRTALDIALTARSRFRFVCSLSAQGRL